MNSTPPEVGIEKEYSQGVCEDGAAILCDGQPLTIEEILDGLRERDKALGKLAAMESQKCVAAKEFGGWDGLESLDEMPNGSRLYATPVPTDKPEIAVWYGSMPESNGKENWTAILYRKGDDKLWGGIADGITIDRSEYPDRVRYEADNMRYLIGEIEKKPFILDYDSDKRSAYEYPADPPAARITEQDAREILKTWGAFHEEVFDIWLEAKGYKLLNKLNADREQVSAVGVLGSEYKIMPKQITEEMAKAFWEEYSKSRTDDLLMRCYEAMYEAAPSHSQQSADAVKAFCKDIGLYDQAYDDQEYIEVSRYKLREHVESLYDRCPSHESEQGGAV